jgi:hypothetical protein
VRRPPVISFLERKHFLNRYLGKARHKILKDAGAGVEAATRGSRPLGVARDKPAFRELI